jgi:prepilin-type N-terminal cleavage/methylation domain-containing protein
MMRTTKSVNMMKILMSRRRRRSEGFSLIEVLVGISVLAVAVIGLAQLFLLAVMNNVRSGDITSAVFLAQQQVDYLRTLTRDELLAFPNTAVGESADEQLDTNGDGTVNYRRLTLVSFQDPQFNIRILVFPGSRADTSETDLLTDPRLERVQADIHTVISR